MLSLSLLLVLVVVCALAFDYINGFHDTANAIATVVSTRVLSPRKAIIMAACLNFIGALVSTQVAITVASGLVDTARFQIAEIHQPAEFAAKLKHPVDPVSRYLVEQLSPATQELLGEFTVGGDAAPELQTAMVADLNRVLQQADLYSAVRFAGIALRPKKVEKASNSGKLKPEELANVNHTLLEIWYPQQFFPCPDRRLVRCGHHPRRVALCPLGGDSPQGAHPAGGFSGNGLYYRIFADGGDF